MIAPVVIGDAAIYPGCCLESLLQLPEQSVQCCVTSPPYWGLRDYGVPGQFGLESTPDEFVAKMVAVFREVRRVLRDDGTLWVNIGDSYARDITSGPSGFNGKHAYIGTKPPPQMNLKCYGGSLKPKDLCGIPWMVAFALRADGWYLRSDIIWSKPNPMPESVKDRPTKAHEYLFLLSKSQRYYYDAGAIKERCVQDEMANGFRGGAYCNNETFDNAEGGKRKTMGNYKMPDGWDTGPGGHGSFHRDGREKGRSARDNFKREGSKREQAIPNQTKGTHRTDRDDSQYDLGTRNKRTVWTVATQPYKEAHFATFPPKLIEPCILAGSRPGDIVLDPFNGSGTTGVVSLKHGRQYIGCELNPDYINLTVPRLQQAQQQLKLSL